MIADSDDVLRIFGTETRESFYVAQENIELLEDSDNKLIRNRLIRDYYKGYDPLSGEYTPKEKYLFMFPDDRNDSVIRNQQQKETHDLLVRIHGAFRDPLIQSHEAAKLSSVNTLPTNDFLKRFGGFFHSSKLTSFVTSHSYFHTFRSHPCTAFCHFNLHYLTFCSATLKFFVSLSSANLLNSC